ncbi:MAG: hypothetical protein V4658_06925 [Bacteroidota bacterium]
MKYLCIPVIILLLMPCVHAQQISLVIAPATGFNLQLGTVTNFTVVNSSGSAKTALVRYYLKNLNGVLAEGSKSNVSIEPGANSFTYSGSDLTYTSIASGFAVDMFGNIPYGNYNFCVDVINPSTLEPYASSCSDVQAILLSPPMLVTPVNKQEVYTLNPLLSWLPPGPAINQGFTYKIKLAEILANQNAYDAVFNNYALLEEQDIPTTNLLYPISAPALEYGKTYAWKIFAYAGGTLAGETDIWSFTPVMPDTGSKKTIKTAPIIILDAEKNKKAVVVTNVLRIQSNELINVASPDVLITDLASAPLSSSNITIKAQDNGVFAITFSNEGAMKDKTFLVRVKTPKNKLLYATFTFKTDY